MNSFKTDHSSSYWYYVVTSMFSWVLKFKTHCHLPCLFQSNVVSYYLGSSDKSSAQSQLQKLISELWSRKHQLRSKSPVMPFFHILCLVLYLSAAHSGSFVHRPVYMYMESTLSSSSLVRHISISVISCHKEQFKSNLFVSYLWCSPEFYPCIKLSISFFNSLLNRFSKISLIQYFKCFYKLLI